MSKHTPGPWDFLEVEDHDSDENSCRPLTICGPSGDDLANVYSSDDSAVSISREEAVANARLIAASPRLLEACKAAEEWLSGWASAEPYIDVIRAAIREAEGVKDGGEQVRSEAEPAPSPAQTKGEG